ncbi:MAG: DUF1345 domain-containing protein [Gemmobacter sp.]
MKVRGIGRHARFLIALGTGLAAYGLSWAAGLAPTRSPLLAADVMFVTYLALTLPLLRLTPDGLRRRAEMADAGTTLIFLVAVLALGVSLWSIFVALDRAQTDPVELVLGFAALPLGWATLNTLAAFHYAHLFYGRAEETDRGGLAFPGDATPDPWDFVYFAFGVGMTAQVADVAITRTEMRRAVLVHSVAGFVTNTFVLALAVNIAAG